jgi:integrase
MASTTQKTQSSVAQEPSRPVSKRFNFSVRALACLAPPSTGRVYHYDTHEHTPGLCVCITANDTRTFYLYRWVKGRPERVRLGLVGELTVDQARTIAKEKIGLIARGIDPQQAKQEARAEPTFGELFTAYLEKYKKPRRPKSWEQDQNNFDLHLAQWKSRRLSEITRENVMDLHTRIGKDHPYLANRLLALLSVMFNQARNVGIVHTGENPAEGVQRFEEREREKYLAPDAMPKFFAALDELNTKVTADFFRMALFTGQRRANIQAMRWDQVDLNRGLWTIPDTKANRAHTVPLVDEAVKVLQDRRKATEGPWVFPSPLSDTGHLVEPKKAWKAVLNAAGLNGYRIHDLRHTLASWQAAAGTSLHIIGKGLGHSQASTTRRYAHVGNSPIREAMGSAVKGMMAAAKVKKKGPKSPAQKARK